MENKHKYDLNCNCENCYQKSFNNYGEKFVDTAKKGDFKNGKN